MAARPHAAAQDNTGSSVLAQFPPQVSQASPILGSVISLPASPLIAYSIFTGAPTTNISEHLNLIELARRRILLRNARHDLLDSLLPSVHITKDYSALYVFAFGSTDRTSEAHSALAALQLDGLLLSESSTFTPSSIYPCSSSCAAQSIPCPECLNPSRPPARSSAAAQFFPRSSLRLPFHFFLTAVRDRLIDDITEASKRSPEQRQATRLKGGFLLGPCSASSEWSAGWDDSARGRPLIYTHLEVQLSCPTSGASPPARLLVHPVLRPTFYLPLCDHLPTAAGTPITLLPHGVPAYYLSTYSGPTSALTAQFDETLTGLGAGDWKGLLAAAAGQADPSASGSGSGAAKAAGYVIAWLAVQNKQGEDKGMPVIWPVRLCLAYHPSSPSVHARTPLPYHPELPAQLQASPPPPPAVVPAGIPVAKAAAASPAEDETQPATPPQSQATLPEREQLQTPIAPRPRTLTSSPTAESLRAFRSMTLSAKPYTRDVRNVASEVSGYVDSVAKERERERERMKRERENANARGRTASMSGNLPTLNTPPSVPPTSTPDVAGAEEVIAPAAEVTPAPVPTPIAVSIPEAVPDVKPMDVDVDPADDEPSSSQDSSTNSLFSPPSGSASSSPAGEDPMQISEETQVATQPVSRNTLPPTTDAPPVIARSDPFDFFGELSTSWSQPNDFMSMDTGYDMGFNMNIGSLGDSRSGGGDNGMFVLDDGLEVFTDDDFNFFDAPTTRNPAAPMTPLQVDSLIKSEGLTPATGFGFSPQRIGDGIPLSGPGPPLSQPSPWTPFAPASGFNTQAVDFHPAIGIPPAPDLLPASPTRTLSSYSAPATPAVQLADPQESLGTGKANRLSLGPSIFDPIPFATSHRFADGKYTFGKFALPSPSDDEDRAESLFIPSSAPSSLNGWRLKYSVATDPRIGVMRKLIGIKRKSFTQGIRELRLLPPWLKEHEEWESSASSPWAEEARSEGDSEEEEPWIDDDDVTAVSRPTTPPPSYLPLGPTLLQTNFHHSRLLPLSSPLRPPGAAVQASSSNNVLVSVPTPVSPAAVLGAASEKSKSLEAAAQLLVKELVENTAWADAWRENMAVSQNSQGHPSEVWQTDVKRVEWLLSNIDPLQTPLALHVLYGQETSSSTTSESASSSKLMLLAPPALAVGKSGTVVQLLPSALRFWEKLGLGPRAGSKDVTAFVFYEATSEDRESQLSQWLDNVSKAYSARNYGAHVPGTAIDCARPGLIPARLDSFKKTLGNFIATLSPYPGSNLVFYIITPISVIDPASPSLRQIFSAIKRASKQHPDVEILYHLVPEALTASGYGDSRSSHGGLESFAASVYDRILRPVERFMTRPLSAAQLSSRACFQAPSYALARARMATGSVQVGPRIRYALEPQPSSLDVMDRLTFLHVGYQLSSCGRWILAACVDEWGDAYELGAWLAPEEQLEISIASQVWAFALNFAKRANIEWRIVLAKLGTMHASELTAWTELLDNEVSKPSQVPPMHVTLLAAAHTNPWFFISPNDASHARPPLNASPPATSRSSSRTHHGVVFANMSTAIYAVLPPLEISLVPSIDCGASGENDIGAANRPFIPDNDEEEPLLQQHSSLRTSGHSMLIHVPAGRDHTSIHMTHFHRLYATRSRSSSKRRPAIDKDAAGQGPAADEPDVDDDRTFVELTQNYHALAVLAQSRWNLTDYPELPLHLAALEVMRVALSGEPAGP
ncbi:hypothetical protein WOLCODRAFT_163279 [Wolfiporia cocos MD-104 SS10]|uniref:Mediator of RNA polymerase II transcription subunit 13 n=1 Tax=Wolfiporia cocos (strain MD-104) TaxID=742152 RepID=A0A2H3JP10_WOLCO|nr:hypothetical protein WOLCODRAFT_163279 [Wolfiporia cocos MD-104 SS10]